MVIPVIRPMMVEQIICWEIKVGEASFSNETMMYPRAEATPESKPALNNFERLLILKEAYTPTTPGKKVMSICSIELSKPRLNNTEIKRAVRIPGTDPTRTAVSIGAKAIGIKLGISAINGSLLKKSDCPDSIMIRKIIRLRTIKTLIIIMK